MIIRLLRRWLVPTLLIVVALRQIFLAHTADLLPARGGGFGMFSSTDSFSNRLVIVEATDLQGNFADLDLSYPSDPGFDRQGRLMVSMPQRQILKDVATHLLNAEFVSVDTPVWGNRQPEDIPSLPPDSDPSQNTALRIATPTSMALSPAIEPVQLEWVRLQVWRLRHEVGSNRVWHEPVSQRVEVRR